MKMQSKSLSIVAIILAICGWIIPSLIAWISYAMAPLDAPTVPVFLWLPLIVLFIGFEIAAVVVAIITRETVTAKVGCCLAIPSLLLFAWLATYFTMNPVFGPKSQTRAFLQALHNQDWRDLWTLTHFTQMQLRVWQNPERYERDMLINLRAPGVSEMFGYFTQLRDIKVGEPVIHLGTAIVPVSSTLPYKGRLLHLHGVAHLREQNGVWRVVISETDADDPYVRLSELIGIPYTSQSQ